MKSSKDKRSGKFRVDFHTHVYTNHRNTKWWAEPGPRDLQTFTNKYLLSGLNGAAYTCFNDDRYELLMNTAKDLPKSWRFDESERGAVITREDGKRFYWFKGQEVPTLEGHILLVGIRRGYLIQPNRDVVETLSLLDEQVIRIADHPLMKIIGDSERKHSGIGLMSLTENARLFDAAEWNGNCFISNKNLDGICEVLGINVVANTDGYRFSSIGRSYTEFNSKDLDFSSIDCLLTMMKKNIRRGNFTTRRSNNYLSSILHHMTMAKWYQFLGKCGVEVNHHII